MKPFNAIRPVIFINPISLPKLPYYYPLWKRHIEYPKYQLGDPKLRMYLCPFWMKLVRPSRPTSEQVLTFKVQPQMTEVDIKQYLKKLYNVDAVQVRTKSIYNDLEPLELKDDPMRFYFLSANPYAVKPPPERYEKVALVTLPPGEFFKFPDIFKSKDDQKANDDVKDKAVGEPKVGDESSWKRPGLPKWFSS